MVEKLTVVEGSMFSGKTLELIREAERIKVSGKKVQVFKPAIDDRGEGNEHIKTRFAGASWPAIAVRESSQIIPQIRKGTDVVIIDEAQFISDKTSDGKWGLVTVIDDLLDKDIQVVVGGLPRDFRREPFGPMAEILVRAQEVRQTFAICTHSEDGIQCNKPATETQRFVNGQPASWNDPVVLVGDVQEGYAARCVTHHVVLDKPKGDVYKSKK